MKYYFNKNGNDTNTDYIRTYYTRYIIYMLGFLIITFEHPLGQKYYDGIVVFPTKHFHHKT